MIGAIASIAILIGFAVLPAGDQVEDALKESEHQLITDDDVFGLGLFEIVCGNNQHIYIFIVLYITMSIVFIICVFYIIIASLLIHGARTVTILNILQGISELYCRAAQAS